MNPNQFDQHDSFQENHETETKPTGLSAASILATVLMLVFGFSGIMGILGVLMSLSVGSGSGAGPKPGAIQNAPPVAETTNETTGAEPSSTGPMSSDDPAVQTGGGIQNPGALANPFAVPISPWQIALGILDFILAIPMVLWSIFVLQHKRPAAVKLAWLALLMAGLLIPRAIISYLNLPEIVEGIRTATMTSLEQQPNSKLRPEDLDTLLQVYYYSILGCSGIYMVLTLITYLFCFFQLRKPTTLARLSP